MKASYAPMARPKCSETHKLKQQAVRLLANGCTQTEVASILRRNLRTIQKWVADPDFKQKLQELKDKVQVSQVEVGAAIAAQSHQEIEEVFVTTARRAPPLVEEAFTVIKEVLISPDSRTADKLKAATLLGKWAGLEIDFNTAIAALRKYGLVLRPGETGEWEVVALKVDCESYNV